MACRVTCLDSRRGPRAIIRNTCVVVDCLQGAHPVAASSTRTLLDHGVTLDAVRSRNAHSLVSNGLTPGLCTMNNTQFTFVLYVIHKHIGYFCNHIA